MKEVKALIHNAQQSMRVALVVSLFNEPVTTALKEGAIARLTELGVQSSDMTLIEVPGAVEIPWVLMKLAQKKEFDVLIALGAVIRGDTTHYDYVCSQVSEGCQRVMLDYDVPVVFGVLTTENDEQAMERIGGKHGHKGRDAADCAVMMNSIRAQLA